MTTLPTVDDPFMTVPEVAKIFAVKPYTVRHWIKEGKLEGVKLPGGQWRVRRSTITEFAQKMYGDNND